MPKKSPKKKAKKRAKKPVTPNRVLNMAAAERITGISRETLKQYKRAGCPAFQVNGTIMIDQLLAWAKEHPAEEKKAVRHKIPNEKDADEFKMGINEAWKRVLKNERDSYALYKSLQKDPEANAYQIKDAEERWNNSLDKLRMYEKSLDKNTRSDDEMIPRKEVELIIQNWIMWHNIGISDALRRICPDLERLKSIGLLTVIEIAVIINPILRESSRLALQAGMAAKKLPPWLVESALIGIKEVYPK